MVCDRCVMVVSDILRQAGIVGASVSLGMAVVPGAVAPALLADVAERLAAVGFELIESPAGRLCENIKACVRRFVLSSDLDPSLRLADYLSDHLHTDYSTLSSSFSEREGRTLEQYYIHVRNERAKELIAYGDHTLGEIADLLRFSSVSHFSNQFKKLTGMSPSAYKALSVKPRTPVDKV